MEGGITVSTPQSRGDGNHTFSLETGGPPDGRPPGGVIRCLSGRPVSPVRPGDRVVAGHSVLPIHSVDSAGLAGGSVCDRGQPQIAHVCGSFSSGKGRFHIKLESLENDISLPSDEFDFKGFEGVEIVQK